MNENIEQENKIIDIQDEHEILWSKSKKSKSEPDKKLLIHLLETGSVAQTLLKKSVFYPILLELSNRISLPKDKIIALVGYLASLHDIGKIHPAFIGQIPAYKEYLQKNELYCSVSKFRHEQYGSLILKKIWEEKKRFSDRRMRRNLSTIIQFHHQGKGGKDGKMNPDREAHWKKYQEEYEEILFNQFKPPLNFEIEHMDAVCMSLLGILVISDWIASGKDFRDTKDTLSNDEIIKNAVEITEKFLEKNNMLHNDSFPQISDFTELWNFIPREGMRPLQVEAEKFFEDPTEKPLAVIIEAPMGEGKTEAAMYMAMQLAKRWNKEGFYIALPTAATSNQMYSRINAMLEHLNLPKSKLMHAMAWLIDKTSENNFSGDSADSAKLWTAPLRRGLISPFAVGTIDQVMMSVMRTKYGVLRLAGLEQKVLIIDEIHSYDAYMSAIIETLLKWCAVFHVPVIMLSATLPMSKKQDFAHCYANSDIETMNKNVYPAMTFFYEDKPAKQIAVQGCHQQRTIKIDNKPWLRELDSLVHSVKEKINAYGGCFCIIRNTVREAQDTYEALKKEMPDTPLLLFHAQFSAERRQQLEQQCIECFGNNKEKRPQKLILVATQVVEQSLDLDFDYLVSDICPIDLLLQRAGRLWRHDDTPRPQGLEPEITILNPSNNNYGDSGLIYAEIILEKTRKVLENKSSLSLPKDIPELVEQVYNEFDSTELEKWDANIIEKWIEYTTDEEIKEGSANLQMLDEPDERAFYFANADDLFFSDDADHFIAIKTRLGEPTIKISLLPKDLFMKAQQMQENKEKATENIEIVDKILLHSVSVAYKKVAFLEKYKDDPKIIKGSSLLYGIFLLEAENDSFIMSDGHSIVMDKELGLIIHENKKSKN